MFETRAAKLAQAMDNRILKTGLAMLSATNFAMFIDIRKGEFSWDVRNSLPGVNKC
jgi:hypothetical protein